MIEEKLEKLPTEISEFIRASSLVSTTKTAVEELILNSIDAGANSIEIFINMKKFNIEVVDNGGGLTFEELKDCGTSRQMSCSRRTDKTVPKYYGSKGEALLSISSLSRLKITSRSRNSSNTYSKNCFTNKITKLPNVSMHGTSVIIEDLFYNIPVRRKSTRANIEILKIKNLIQKLSILRHSISWVFIDRHSNKLICRYDPAKSVAQRISLLHTPTIVNKMKEVNYSYGNFTLVGLLSPPFPVNCHSTKEYQYFYINNRYVKQLDIITKAIDTIFVSLVSLSKSYGPARKHSDTGKSQSICHPCFVVQLICPQNEYEILWDTPDTHSVIFRKSAELSHCVFELLKTWFSTYRSEMLPALLSILSDASASVSASVSVSGNGYYKLVGQQSLAKNDPAKTDDNCDDDFLIPNNTHNSKRDSNGHKGNMSPFSPHAINLLPTSPPTSRTSAMLDSDSMHSEGEYPSPVSFTSAFLPSPEEVFSASLRPFHPQYVQEDELPVEQTNSHRPSSPFGVTVRRQPCAVEDYFDAKYNSPDSLGSAESLHNCREVPLTIPIRPGNTPSSSEGVTNYAGEKRSRDGYSSQTSQKFDDADNGYRNEPPPSKQAHKNQHKGNVFSSEIDNEYYRMISMEQNEGNGDCEGDSPESQRENYPLESPGYVSNDLNGHMLEERDDKYRDRNKDKDWDRRRYLDSDNSSGSGSGSGSGNNFSPVENIKKRLRSEYIDNLIDSDSTVSACSNDLIHTPNTSLPAYCSMDSSESDSNDFRGTVGIEQYDGDESSSELHLKYKRDQEYLQRKIWYPPIPRKKSDALPSGLGLRLGREIFEELLVVGQAAESFIICHMLDGMMLCLDQHAADERNQLEQLERDASVPCGEAVPATSWLTSAAMKSSHTVAVTLGDEDYSSLEQYKPIMERWGFYYLLLPADNSDNKHVLQVQKLPILAGESLTISDLLEFSRFVTSHLYLPESLLRPPAFRRILASKACHNAVRFGDHLNIDECQGIINKLAITQFPFQCAHGRPSVIPLIQLQELHKPKKFFTSKLFSKPNYRKVLEIK